MTLKPMQPTQSPMRHRRQRSAVRSALPQRALLKPVVLPVSLSDTFLRIQKVWRLPRLLQNVAFCRNPRLRTTVARWVLAKHRIELGPRFFALRQSQPQILCHEVAHAAAVALHGRRVMPHGPEWRALVEVAGFRPETQLKTHRRTEAPRPRTAISRRFEHRCPVCQAVRFSKRAARRWRCVECTASGLPGQLMISEVQPRHRPP